MAVEANERKDMRFASARGQDAKSWLIGGETARRNPFYFSYQIPRKRRGKKEGTQSNSVRTANRVLLPKQSPSVVNFGENSSFEVGRTLVFFHPRHRVPPFLSVEELAYFLLLFFGCSYSSQFRLKVLMRRDYMAVARFPKGEWKKSCIRRCQRAV